MKDADNRMICHCENPAHCPLSINDEQTFLNCFLTGCKWLELGGARFTGYPKEW